MIEVKHGITNCPMVIVQKIFSSKWSLLAIYYLKDGPVRFNELLRMFDGITHATLTKQLKWLEECGIVNRRVYEQIPPKVEYSLTDLGHKLTPTLECMEEWGQEYVNQIKK